MNNGVKLGFVSTAVQPSGKDKSLVKLCHVPRGTQIWHRSHSLVSNGQRENLTLNSWIFTFQRNVELSQGCLRWWPFQIE
eukprot:s370_g37.t1